VISLFFFFFCVNEGLLFLEGHQLFCIIIHIIPRWKKKKKYLGIARKAKGYNQQHWPVSRQSRFRSFVQCSPKFSFYWFSEKIRIHFWHFLKRENSLVDTLNWFARLFGFISRADDLGNVDVDSQQRPTFASKEEKVSELYFFFHTS
jgi:hypothetical protein